MLGPVNVYNSHGSLIGNFSTIQDAVDFAGTLAGAGKLITVDGLSADGQTPNPAFVEQVVIDGGKAGLASNALDNLTIKSINDAVLEAPSASALVSTGNSVTNGRDLDGVLTIKNTTGVSVVGLKVDGYGQGANLASGQQNATEVGIAVLNATGTVLNGVDVENVREADGGFGNQRGMAVYAANTGANVTNSFTIENSSISNFQKSGLVIQNAAATVTNNTVSGVVTAATAQNAIQIGGSSGSVDHNTISNVGYTRDDGTYDGAGILEYDGNNLAIDSNSITLGGVYSTGVFAYDNAGTQLNVSVTNNTIVGAGPTGGTDHANYNAGIDYQNGTGGAVTGNIISNFDVGLEDDAGPGGTTAPVLSNNTFGSGIGSEYFRGDGTTSPTDFIANNQFSASGPGTIYVTGAGAPDTVFSSIQAAIDAAASGDTIHVGAGTYAGHVTINKEVILQGANAGTAADGGAPGGPTTVITGGIDITAVGATVDGVTVSGSFDSVAQDGTDLPNGIVVSANDVTITNSVLTGDAQDSRPFSTSGGISGFSFTHNLVEGWAEGAYIVDGGSGEIANNSFDGNGNGVVTESTGVAIHGNSFDSSGNASAGADIAALPFADATIGGYIYANTYTPGLQRPISVYPNGPDGQVVTGSDVPTTFHTEYSGHAVSLTGGSGDDRFIGGAGSDSFDGGAGADTVSYQNDTQGVTVDLTAGLASGSGIGSTTLTNIENVVGGSGNDTLTGDGAASLLAGGAGIDTVVYGGATTSNLSVVNNLWVIAGAHGTDTLANVEEVDGGSGHKILLVGDGGFSTIQAAIDAALDGDTIKVASGTYSENLNINKAVTIEGANAGLDGTSTSRGDETVLSGESQINTTGQVTIDGVEFLDAQAYTLSSADTFVALTVNQTAADGDVIKNSVFNRAPVSNPGGYTGSFVGSGAQPTHRGLVIASVGTGQSITVSGNLFTGSNPYGYAGNDWRSDIYSNGGDGTTIISGNTFKNSRSAINADNFSANVTIDGNNFSNPATAISIGAGSSVDPITTITNNTFDRVDTDINLSNVTTPVTFDAAATGNILASQLSSPSEVFYIQGGPGGGTYTGTTGSDLVTGGAGADVVNHTAGNDAFSGSGGIDIAQGYSAGFGLALFTPAPTQQVPTPAPTWTVTDGTSTDTLTGVEKVVIAGQTYDLVDNFGANTGGYQGIQAGLAAAASGDVVAVASGTYAESFTIPNMVTIENIGGDVTVAPASGGYTNNGTVLATTGTLTFSGPLTSTGTLSAAAGAVLAVNGTGSDLSGTLAGAGTLSINGSAAFTGVTSDTVANLSVLGSVTVGQNLGYAGNLSTATGSSIAITSGDTLTLSGTSALAGAVTGAGTLLLGGGTTFFNTGATATVANLAVSGTTTTVKFNDSLTYASNLSEGAESTIRIGTGAFLTLTGTSTLAGSVLGLGTLVLAGGGNTSFATGVKLGSLSGLSVSDTGTVVTINDTLNYAGVLNASGGTLNLATGAKLLLNGVDTFSGATLNGAGRLTTRGTTVITGLTVGGTDVLDNTGTLTQSGNLRLGNISGKTAALVNEAAGTYSLTADTGISLGSSSPSTITNAGLFQKTAGTGTSTIAPAISSSGTINASSGTLAFKGSGNSISGSITGTATVAFGGTTTFQAGASATVANLTLLNAGTLTFAGSLGYGGSFTAALGSSLVIGAGKTLTLSGISSLAGSITGTGTLAVTGGTTTLRTGAAASVASISVSGSSTTLAVAANLSYGGRLSLASGSKLNVTSGNTLTLTGVSTLAGTVVGASTLALSGGGSTTIASGASLSSLGNLTVAGATTALTINTSVTNAGNVSFGLGTTLTVTAGSSLILSGTATFTSDTLKGSGRLVVKGQTSMSGLTVGGTAVFDNAGAVTESGGSVRVGDTSGSPATIVNEAAATYTFADDSGVTQGTSTASSIKNAGLLHKTGGTGTSTIGTSVINTGTIEAASGTLDFQAAISGSGSQLILNAATLELDAMVQAGQNVSFGQGGGTLLLNDAQDFKASISGFGTGDTIDVGHFGPATSFTFTENSAHTQGVLKLTDGANQASLVLRGIYSSADFLKTAGSHGDTLITYNH